MPTGTGQRIQILRTRRANGDPRRLFRGETGKQRPREETGRSRQVDYRPLVYPDRYHDCFCGIHRP